MRQIGRRDFNKTLLASGALLGFSTATVSAQSTVSGGASKWVTIQPGYMYDFILPQADKIQIGTQWKGDVVRNRTVNPTAKNPLEPMYRKRLVLKLDDLASWSFPSWERYIKVVEKSGGKADLGINPGTCGPEVWEWLRTLDMNRFELWNHTWDHGSGGTRQFGHTYDIQYKHLDMAQQKVKDELKITMHAFGIPGIRPYPEADEWIGDSDEVTYYVVRNHPDLVAHFEAKQFADRGLGMINSEGILVLDNPIDLEHPDELNTQPETREYNRKYFVQTVKDLYPDEDPNRVCGVGNPGEIIWRFEHPYRNRDSVSKLNAIYIQCHPWNWDSGRGLESVAAWIAYVTDGAEWRMSNHYEVYKWLKDKEFISIEKTSANRYRLDAHRLYFSHTLEMALPSETAVEKIAYIDPSTKEVKHTKAGI